MSSVIEVKKLATWKEFHALFVDTPEPHCIYRGQRDPAWKLSSKFERQISDFKARRKDDDTPYEHHKGVQMAALNRFKNYSRGLLGPTRQLLDSSPVEWWFVLGRHFGLVTPILDWTFSPYIAAWFACHEYITNFNVTEFRDPKFVPKDPVVWQLDILHARRSCKELAFITDPPIESLTRNRLQQSCYTWLDSPDHYDLESALVASDCADALRKIIIPAGSLPPIVRNLGQMGIINPATN